MSIITKEGFDFAFDPKGCNSCEGNCCIGESGNIWINRQEIENLSRYLDLSLDQLREKFLEKRAYKYSIREVRLSKDNYACVFFNLDKKQCSIYEARPIQCRTFPFWDYFKENKEEVKKECPAIREL